MTQADRYGSRSNFEWYWEQIVNFCIEILSEAQFAGWMRMIEDCRYVGEVHLILSKIRHKMKPWAGQFPCPMCATKQTAAQEELRFD